MTFWLIRLYLAVSPVVLVNRYLTKSKVNNCINCYRDPSVADRTNNEMSKELKVVVI